MISLWSYAVRSLDRASRQSGANKAVLDDRLPASIRDDLRKYNLHPAVEGAPPVAGVRP